MKIARDAARQLKVELIERPVASVDELRAGLRALRPGERGCALLRVGCDGEQPGRDLIIDTARAKTAADDARVRGERRQGGACQLW